MLVIAGTWSIPTVTGTVPKRCGYSSFLKLSEHNALVFGGVAEGKRVSDVYILNMQTWVRFKPATEIV